MRVTGRQSCGQQCLFVQTVIIKNNHNVLTVCPEPQGKGQTQSLNVGVRTFICPLPPPPPPFCRESVNVDMSAVLKLKNTNN